MDTQGINVVQLSDEYQNAILMVWSEKPTHKEVNLAFDAFRGILENATTTYHCIVDLRRNPAFPLAATFNGAMQIQSHRNMGKWLVIGGNATAKFIGRTISSVVQNNVEWLNSETDAYQRLQTLLLQDKNDNLEKP